jgi:DNA-binding CsgD family transcriptional regulator
VSCWLGEALAVDAVVDGEALRLDHAGLRRWARRIEAIQWPEATRVGILVTEEVRAWRFDMQLAAIGAIPAPKRLLIGPVAAVASRRDRLWKAETAEDRDALWALMQVEELAASGLQCLEGLIVPGGRIYVSPFSVPADPRQSSERKRQVTARLQRLDDALGTDRAPLRAKQADDESAIAAAVDSGPTPEAKLVAGPAEAEAARREDEREAALSQLVPRLPRRQRALLTALSGASSTAEAARKLDMNEATARKHFEAILKRARG